MRRIILMGLICLVCQLAGCQNVRGPLGRSPERVDDPRLPIAEQERRGRDRLALPDHQNVGPDAAFTVPR